MPGCKTAVSAVKKFVWGLPGLIVLLLMLVAASLLWYYRAHSESSPREKSIDLGSMLRDQLREEFTPKKPDSQRRVSDVMYRTDRTEEDEREVFIPEVERSIREGQYDFRGFVFKDGFDLFKDKVFDNYKVKLGAAHFEGSVDFSGAKATQENGIGLWQATVLGNAVFCNGKETPFRTTHISLRQAVICGDLIIEGGSGDDDMIKGDAEISGNLDLVNVAVGGNIILKNLSVGGDINASNVLVGAGSVLIENVKCKNLVFGRFDKEDILAPSTSRWPRNHGFISQENRSFFAQATPTTFTCRNSNIRGNLTVSPRGVLGQVTFAHTEVGEDATFTSLSSGSHASFKGMRVERNVVFRDMQIKSDWICDEAVLGKTLHLEDVKVDGETSFRGVALPSSCEFTDIVLRSGKGADFCRFAKAACRATGDYVEATHWDYEDNCHRWHRRTLDTSTGQAVNPLNWLEWFFIRVAVGYGLKWWRVVVSSAVVFLTYTSIFMGLSPNSSRTTFLPRLCRGMLLSAESFVGLSVLDGRRLPDMKTRWMVASEALLGMLLMVLFAFSLAKYYGL